MMQQPVEHRRSQHRAMPLADTGRTEKDDILGALAKGQAGELFFIIRSV
jgi:hypothetical protein